MSNGVKLYLAAGVVLPPWIVKKLERPDGLAKVEFEEVNGGSQKVRVLKIVGGEATFCYPAKDDVTVKFPDEKHFWGSGFPPQAVLQISTLDGSRVEKNRLLCPKCFDTTGKIVNHRIGPTCVAVIKCRRCGQEWEV
ncbi:MAG: hypothetical protein AAB911_01525 [Patescibacteria group bacterium]